VGQPRAPGPLNLTEPEGNVVGVAGTASAGRRRRRLPYLGRTFMFRTGSQ